MKLCECGRQVTRGRNTRRCERCINQAELHGRWDNERGTAEAPKRPGQSTKTGRLEALVWVHMVLQNSKSQEEFLERLNREIEALDDECD